MNKKASDKVKTQRKKMRAIRKGFIDQERENEGGDAYSTGLF